MERVSRFQYWQRGLIFNYYIHCYQDVGLDKVVRDFQELRSVCVRLDNKLWETWNIRYDGNTSKGFTLLGVSFSASHSFDYEDAN